MWSLWKPRHYWYLPMVKTLILLQRRNWMPSEAGPFVLGVETASWPHWNKHIPGVYSHPTPRGCCQQILGSHGLYPVAGSHRFPPLNSTEKRVSSKILLLFIHFPIFPEVTVFTSPGFLPFILLKITQRHGPPTRKGLSPQIFWLMAQRTKKKMKFVKKIKNYGEVCYFFFITKRNGLKHGHLGWCFLMWFKKKIMAIF